jgi:tetratricopeptide (TPR) repeat protein
MTFAALALGVIVASWQAVQARAEATKAIAINEFLMDMFALVNPAEQTNEYSPTSGGPRVLTIHGLLDEASASLETALSEWPEVRADLYFRLGKTYWGLGQHDKMLSHLRRARELRAGTLGEDHPETLHILTYLGGWLDEMGQLEEAERLHRQAVAGLEAEVGRDDRRTLSAKIWLGTNLISRGKINEGEKILLEIIRIAGDRFGKDDRLTLSGELWYGRSLERLGRYPEIEQRLGEALDLSRSALPEGDLVTAGLAQTVARGLAAQGRRGDAIELLREARESYQLQGAGITFMALDATADLWRAMVALEQHAEAEDVLKSTLEECRSKLGEGHNFTFWALAMHADHLRLQRRFPEALQVLREAKPESWASDNSFTLLLMLIYGFVLRDEGQLAEGEEWLERALEGRRRVLGETHPENLRTLHVLARSADARGDKVEAVARYQEFVDLTRSVDRLETRGAVQAMNALAWLLQERGDPESLAEAEGLARKALTGAPRALDSDDRLNLMIADTLAVVLHLRGNNDAAIMEFEQVAGKGARWGSSVHHGRCLTELERFEEAEAVLLDAYNGDKEPALEALIDLYDAWGKPEKAAEYRELLQEAQDAIDSD